MEAVDREYYEGLLAEVVRERENYNGEAQFRAIQVKILMDALMTIRIGASKANSSAFVDKIYDLATRAIREATEFDALGVPSLPNGERA